MISLFIGLWSLITENERKTYKTEGDERNPDKISLVNEPLGKIIWSVQEKYIVNKWIKHLSICIFWNWGIFWRPPLSLLNGPFSDWSLLPILLTPSMWALVQGTSGGTWLPWPSRTPWVIFEWQLLLSLTCSWKALLRNWENKRNITYILKWKRVKLERAFGVRSQKWQIKMVTAVTTIARLCTLVSRSELAAWVPISVSIVHLAETLWRNCVISP